MDIPSAAGCLGKPTKKSTTRYTLPYATGFTPDGKGLVFESAPVITAGDTNWDVWSIDIDGGNPTKLTDTPDGRRSSTPSVSPDGKYIAYSTNGGAAADFEIWRMDIDGKNKVNLTSHPGFDWHATWSVDGEAIYFLSQRDGRNNVYTMRPDGSEPLQVTYEMESWLQNPVLSPDESAFLVRSQMDGNSEIYLLEGDARTQLTRVGVSED